MVKTYPLALAAVLTCLLCSAPSASAAAGQSGAVPEQGQRAYPYHQCRSPMRPLPGDRRSDWIFYRQEMLDYRTCVERYLTRAREDVDSIRRQMDKAVREFNESSGNL